MARRRQRSAGQPARLDSFGQTGGAIDLFRTYRIDTDAIIDATAELFL